MHYYDKLLRLYKVADLKDYSNLKKTSKRRDNVLLDSGYFSTQTWSGLNKCWKGFKIAKAEWDTKKMEYYAKGIRKFQRELKASVSDFPTTRFNR